jgi:hypothetical protein
MGSFGKVKRREDLGKVPGPGSYEYQESLIKEV